LSIEETNHPAAPDAPDAPAEQDEPAATAGSLPGWRERVGRGLPWLAVAAVSPHLEHDLAKLAGAIRSLGEPPSAGGPLLPLETRRLTGGPAAPGQAAAAAFRRYAHGREARLSGSDLLVLRQDLERVANDPGPALAGGRLIRYRLEQVLDDLGVAREQAAALLLEDLRESLTWESLKRLTWRGGAAQRTTRTRSRASTLTKGQPDAVFTDMDGEMTAFAKRPAAELSRRVLERLVPAADASVAAFLRKLRGAEETDQGSEEGEAREVVRLLERLVELARRYTVDLVGVVEHYLETAQRIWREARQAQARRQLANDKRAIERTLAELDPQAVARSMDALPLYLQLRHSSAGEDTLGTALLPRLADERLTRSYVRLCLRLLQPPYAEQPPAPSADRPPKAAAAHTPTRH
jgi:hypothetical protein